MVFIKDLEVAAAANKTESAADQEEDENAAAATEKLQGTGSGFIWDKFGHIVSMSYIYTLPFPSFLAFPFSCLLLLF